MATTVGIGSLKSVAEPHEALGEPPEAAPAAEQTPPAEPQANAENTPPDKTDEVVFVRNILPNETVILKDGTKIPFKRYIFSTSDETLITKILAEAKGQHIVLRDERK